MSVLQLPEGESADFSQGEVYFIGNATTLIRFGPYVHARALSSGTKRRAAVAAIVV